jgi:hypothetical protein
LRLDVWEMSRAKRHDDQKNSGGVVTLYTVSPRFRRVPPGCDRERNNFWPVRALGPCGEAALGAQNHAAINLAIIQFLSMPPIMRSDPCYSQPLHAEALGACSNPSRTIFASTGSSI